jgi:hypothetical protein
MYRHRDMNSRYTGATAPSEEAVQDGTDCGISPVRILFQAEVLDEESRGAFRARFANELAVACLVLIGGVLYLAASHVDSNDVYKSRVLPLGILTLLDCRAHCGVDLVRVS